MRLWWVNVYWIIILLFMFIYIVSITFSFALFTVHIIHITLYVCAYICLYLSTVFSDIQIHDILIRSLNICYQWWQTYCLSQVNFNEINIYFPYTHTRVSIWKIYCVCFFLFLKMFDFIKINGKRKDSRHHR